MTGEQAVLAVIEALQALRIDYMLVGSMSSNFYGIPRSTQDADFVVELGNVPFDTLRDRLEPPFRFDRQTTFETVSLTIRHVLHIPDANFKIELFRLSDNEHDQERFRQRLPRWHRRLGRLQVALILLLIAPSGLWMAFYAAAGPIAGLGLAMLAILTAAFVVLGLKAAVEGRFAIHRRWMWRTYLLLCSAVVIRIVGGLATVAGVQASWFDPLSSWMSWLVPLVVFESVGRRGGYAQALFVWHFHKN